MDSWSKRRKKMIAYGIAAFAVLVIGFPSFFYLYKAPTCFDSRQNGGEQGVDCGGRCSRLCQSAFLAPSVAWTRFEEVAPGLYNIASYIVNPNTDGKAVAVPYKMSIYDDRGMLITVETGSVTLPPHRNTLAFKGAVSVSNSKPAKVSFEFTAPPDWYRGADPLRSIRVSGKDYSEDQTGSSLSVTLGNDNIVPLDNISVYVVLYDVDGNALGFSKTLVDEIPANGKAIAPFTWGVERQGRVVSIEVLPVAE